jgi:hypothetical protein
MRARIPVTRVDETFGALGSDFRVVIAAPGARALLVRVRRSLVFDALTAPYAVNSSSVAPARPHPDARWRAIRIDDRRGTSTTRRTASDGVTPESAPPARSASCSRSRESAC